MATAMVDDPARPDTSVTSVGERVKVLREGLDLSLRALSERSGVSATMLSQVERGETSPTLQVAERIATGLDLSLSQLLRLDETPHVVVGRAGNYRGKKSGGHSVEVITPAIPGLPSEASRHRLEAGSRTGTPGDAPMHEPGSRETAIILSGRVVLELAGEEIPLTEGDSVTFDADLDHYFVNPGRRPCDFIAVISAGRRTS